MRRLREFIARCRGLFVRRAADRVLETEIASHLSFLEEKYRAQGLSAEEARFAAHREFGNLEWVKEEHRSWRSFLWIENMGRDLRYSSRMLRKNPVFMAVAVISLALGIGANTAVFSLIDALLLRPLPVPHPDRLISIFVNKPKRDNQYYFTYAMFEQIARQRQIFSGVFTWAGHQFQMRSGPDMVHVDGALASGEYFSALGVPAAIGRTLLPDDDKPNGGPDGPVAVISDAFWLRHFQRNPSALGLGLTLDKIRFTIVGVMPPGFFGAEVGTTPDVWVPLWMTTKVDDGRCIASRSCWWLVPMARLKPGISQQQARAALKVLSPQIMRAAMPSDWSAAEQKDLLKWQFIPMPAANGWTFLRIQFSNPTLILMILVAVVLLIACANLANLLLSRASARSREIAVRLAIGAGRGRIIRQLLTESLLLSLMGAATGLLFAHWSTRLLVAFLNAKRQSFGAPGFAENAAFDLHPDWRVLTFTLLAAVASGFLFGMFPALRATKIGISTSLKDRVHHLQTAGSRMGAGRFLLSFQVALSILLIAGAGLFAGSLFHLLTLNPGFNPNNVAVIGIDTDKRPKNSAPLIHLYSQLLDRLNAMPGVRTASLLLYTPLSNSGWDDYLSVRGRPNLPDTQRDTDINLVGPRFFEVMSTPLLAGRDFSATDTTRSEKVGIINQLAARRFFPNSNPIGAQVVLEKDLIRIIGIVGNTKYMDLRESDPLTLYLPYTQATDGLPSLTFVIKTHGDPAAIYPAFRAALRKTASDIPLTLAKTMQEQVADSLGRERLMASLSVFFGILALLLTSIGLYGILAYAVAQRTGEIGVRIALGARQHDVIWLVLRETVRQVGIGLAAGIAAVLLTARLVSSLLYGITPNDPGNLILAVVTLTAVALLAAYLPARRASRLDPMRALREE